MLIGIRGSLPGRCETADPESVKTIHCSVKPPCFPGDATSQALTRGSLDLVEINARVRTALGGE